MRKKTKNIIIFCIDVKSEVMIMDLLNNEKLKLYITNENGFI